jgi:hypothetical protein
MQYGNLRIKEMSIIMESEEPIEETKDQDQDQDQDQDEPEFMEFDEDTPEDEDLIDEDEIPEELNYDEQVRLIKSKKCRLACRVNETIKVNEDRLIVCKGLIIAKKPLVKCTRWKKTENKDGLKKWEREK